MPWQPLRAQSPTVPFARYFVQSWLHVGADVPPLLELLDDPLLEPLELPPEELPVPVPLEEPLLTDPLDDPLCPPDDPPAPLEEEELDDELEDEEDPDDELDAERLDPLDEPVAVLPPEELAFAPPPSSEPRPK